MTHLGNLKLSNGTTRYALLAVVLIVGLAIGYFFFMRLSIVPRLRAREELISELATARKELKDAEALQEQRPTQVSVQVATAQAALRDSLCVFLSDALAADILDRLYQYATESRIEILDLQALPTSQVVIQPQATSLPPTSSPSPAASPTEEGKKAKTGPTPAVSPLPTAPSQPNPLSVEPGQIYEVRSFRLQARGDMPNLLGFIARIKEASLRNCALSNVSIAEAEGRYLLTMDIALYTSPHVAGAGCATSPIATRRLTPFLQPSPIASVRPGLVRPTNWPTNEPWPPDTRATPTGAQTSWPSPLPTLGPTTTSTPTGQGQEVEYVIYIVRYGDTLYSISRRYRTTVEAIKAANGLTSDQIQVGQRLRIPR